MSTFTTKIKDYLDSFSYGQSGLTLGQKIDIGIPHLFDFNIDWYGDTASFDDFKIKFVDRYYMEEIGFETIAQFKLALKSRLELNMPYYKQLYDSSLLDIKPFLTYLHEFQESQTETNNSSVNSTSENNTTENNTSSATGKTTNEGSNTETTSNTGNSKNQQIDSDNPQVNFSGTDYASSMTRGQSDTTQNGNSTNTTNSEINSTDNSSSQNSINNNNTTNTNNSGNSSINRTYKDSGFNGNQSEMILKYRKTFVNINNELVKLCEDLFMGIWDLGQNDCRIYYR